MSVPLACTEPALTIHHAAITHTARTLAHHLRVSPLTLHGRTIADYAYDSQVNGIKASSEPFGVINLLAPQLNDPRFPSDQSNDTAPRAAIVQLRFAFRAGGTNIPLTLSRTSLTFYDFDNGRFGLRECMQLRGSSAGSVFATIAEDSELEEIEYEPTPSLCYLPAAVRCPAQPHLLSHRYNATDLLVHGAGADEPQVIRDLLATAPTLLGSAAQGEAGQQTSSSDALPLFWDAHADPVVTPLYCGTQWGRGADNPVDPIELTPQQRRRAILYTFEEVGAFDVRFSLTGDVVAAGGRNLLFAGYSNVQARGTRTHAPELPRRILRLLLAERRARACVRVGATGGTAPVHPAARTASTASAAATTARAAAAVAATTITSPAAAVTALSFATPAIAFTTTTFAATDVTSTIAATAISISTCTFAATTFAIDAAVVAAAATSVAGETAAALAAAAVAATAVPATSVAATQQSWRPVRSHRELHSHSRR